MILTLKRLESSESGIFGVLLAESGTQIACTLEHAYLAPYSSSWHPKIPPGKYLCVRGLHQLASMKVPFTTFEILGVAGHSNLLFHCGNSNADSEGCVLLGLGRRGILILESHLAFDGFMKDVESVDSFTLEVV